MLSSAPGDERDARRRRPPAGGVVGRAGCRRRDAGRAAWRSGRPAGSGRGRGRRAARSPRSAPSSRALQRVGHRHRRDRAAACRRARRSAASIVPGGMNGRAASWTSTMSGACGASASSPARTLSCRVAPPGTGGRCGDAARAPPRSARPRRPAAAASTSARQRLGGVADHRLAGERQELLRRLAAETAAGCRRRPGWRRCAWAEQCVAWRGARAKSLPAGDCASTRRKAA